MNTRCSIALLESALAGNLPAQDETSLHRHLEACEACSAALERMAGGPAWCQEAAALLTGDELDAALPARDEWSEVDFTVEHLEPADEPNVLGRLGGYDVLQIIGHGGMGVVLKGFDRELKRSVAIKVLAPHLAQSSLAKKRFAREAQAAAAVVHPHVLAIHQVQASGRLPFLVMPLVAGESLAERLTAQGTLELKETLRIGMQAAAGLAAAHEQGLVHRDVKPANILLEKGVERAVLTDFGLARAADDVALTRWGIIAGTPQYMSPEQARGEPLDGRSDLFSLGCVLYEMATGVSPFRTDSIMATMRRLVDDSPRALASLNPELPPWFIAIVERLLEKDPSRRFSSAQEVSDLLEGCLAHVQQPAAVPLPASLAPHTIRGRSIFNSHRKGVVAMLGALGCTLLGMVLWQASEAPDIAGNWTGEGWGAVVLTKANGAEYAGTYSDTFGKQPGEIKLKWSRVERRFNGTWREGEDRFGELSVRLLGDEIRGAHTTDPGSRINPATPRLADLSWSRGSAKDAPVVPPMRTADPVEFPDEKYVAQDQDKAKALISVAKLAWGEAKNGLRLAAMPDPDTAKLGEPVPFFLVVENVSDHAIKFSVSDVTQIAQAEVRTTGRNQVETQSTWHTGVSPLEYYRLRPGQQALLAKPSVMVVEKGSKEHNFGCTRIILPGDAKLRNNIFVVRYTLTIGSGGTWSRGNDGMMHRTSPAKGEWTGTLTSGEMAINAVRKVEDANPAHGEATKATPEATKVP